MIIVTTENIVNHRIVEIKGPAFGLTVRARGLGKDITAALKGLVGGEISQYTEMLEDARKQALDRLVQNAQAMGANAVVMMRFDSGEIGANMSEIVAYGTAVVAEPIGS
ncbi:YbjQ family protein [Aneurinibacillus sp. BA2021]|nr:YbjQ family protein [Aneurinibacillus sp. BA2021]